MSQGQRDMQRLAREVAGTTGWTATRTRRGRWIFRGPAGQLISAASTPSDPGGPTAARRDLKRAGWDHAK